MGGTLRPANDLLPLLPPAMAPLLSEKELDCKQKGSGIAPIIGFNYNYEALNIGMKYEFKTGLKLKNETAANTTGVVDYNDGIEIPYDIPALFAAGVSYDIIPEVKLSVGYHHFFDSDAKMANDKQKFINGGVNEYLAGIEYRINRMFLVSCGTQITRQGVTDDYQTDMSFSINSYSLGFGGAINITKNIRINLAYFFTNYEDWTKNMSDYGKLHTIVASFPATAGTDVFGRTNQSFGVGVDFRF
jgi:long-chain fatty acid transport protein